MGAVEGEAVRERVAGGCEELLEKVEPSEHGRGALDGAPQGCVELLDDGASLWQDRRDLQGVGTSRLSEGASPCAGMGQVAAAVSEGGVGVVEGVEESTVDKVGREGEEGEVGGDTTINGGDAGDGDGRDSEGALVEYD